MYTALRGSSIDQVEDAVRSGAVLTSQVRTTKSMQFDDHALTEAVQKLKQREAMSCVSRARE